MGDFWKYFFIIFFKFYSFFIFFYFYIWRNIMTAIPTVRLENGL
uniref:Uncharacterized protein n=1 Tax=Meloidogyne enterolobii TaxID=390850 RepID=A0A6V7UDS6_MELEN|nr:unnamed protein product [Meloidogyne enterolobii]